MYLSNAICLFIKFNKSTRKLKLISHLFGSLLQYFPLSCMSQVCKVCTFYFVCMFWFLGFLSMKHPLALLHLSMQSQFFLCRFPTGWYSWSWVFKPVFLSFDLSSSIYYFLMYYYRIFVLLFLLVIFFMHFEFSQFMLPPLPYFYNSMRLHLPITIGEPSR